MRMPMTNRSIQGLVTPKPGEEPDDHQTADDGGGAVAGGVDSTAPPATISLRNFEYRPAGADGSGAGAGSVCSFVWSVGVLIGPEPRSRHVAPQRPQR